LIATLTTFTSGAPKVTEFGEITQSKAIPPFKVIQGHRQGCDEVRIRIRPFDDVRTSNVFNRFEIRRIFFKFLSALLSNTNLWKNRCSLTDFTCTESQRRCKLTHYPCLRIAVFMGREHVHVYRPQRTST